MGEGVGGWVGGLMGWCVDDWSVWFLDVFVDGVLSLWRGLISRKFGTVEWAVIIVLLLMGGWMYGWVN